MFMEKKEVRRIAAVTGLTGAALYVICAVLWLVVPDFTAYLGNLIFHGITVGSNVSIGLVDFILGLTLSFAGGAAVGALFAYFYGKVA